MNDELSSGHILISNNARPMPKLGLNGKFEIKRNQVDSTHHVLKEYIITCLDGALLLNH